MAHVIERMGGCYHEWNNGFYFENNELCRGLGYINRSTFCSINYFETRLWKDMFLGTCEREKNKMASCVFYEQKIDEEDESGFWFCVKCSWLSITK